MMDILSDRGKPHILYMEDDDSLAQLVRRRLLRHGFEVDTAPDGQIGLEKMQSCHYDVVVLDYNMPVISGMDVLKRLVKDAASPPAVMVSGVGRVEVAIEAMRLGAADYVIKETGGNYLQLLPGIIDKVIEKKRLIREKEMAEAALRESELRFRSVTATAIDAIISADDQGNIIFWNRGAASIFGYQEEEIQGRCLTMLIPERYRRAHVEALQRVQATGESRLNDQVVELFGLRKDGTEFPLEISLASWLVDRRRFFSSVIRDITERRNAEAQTRKEQQFSHHVIEGMSGIFYLFDKAGLIQRWNRNFQEITGYSDEEMRHKHVLDFIPEDERVLVGERIQQVFVGGYASVEGHLLSKTGQKTPYYFTGTRVEIGGSQYLTGTGLDISERIAQEEQTRRFLQTQTVINALLQSMTEIRTLDRQLELALSLILSKGWMKTLDRGAIFLHDEDRNELVLRTQRGLATPLLKTCSRVRYGCCLCGRALELGEVVFAESSDLYHSNSYHGMQPHAHYCVPIVSGDEILGIINIYMPEGHKQDPEEEAFLVAIANTLSGIIERKKLDEALQRAKVMAEHANMAKSRFLAAMSHDIRTPMNAILGMGDVLRDSGLNPEQHNALKVLTHAGEGLLALINDILDLSKVEAGQLQMEVLSFDLYELIEGTRYIMYQNAQAKGLDFEFQIQPSCPRQVVGDPQRLQQVLLNLLGNAIKFTERGRISLLVEAAEGDYIKMVVSDTGIGIPEMQLGRIFDPFRQAEHDTSRRFGGTGLGLAICSRLVAAMGGKIEVESTLGEGTVFRVIVRLPKSKKAIADAELASVPGGEVEQKQVVVQSMAGDESKHILLVDDAEDNRFVITAFLKRTPHRLTTAINGEEAVRIFKSEVFDLVLMDMRMPVLDGFGATLQIRAWEHEQQRLPTPVIALTADAMREDVEKTASVGCDMHLSKPISKARLLDVISQFRSNAVTG